MHQIEVRNESRLETTFTACIVAAVIQSKPYTFKIFYMRTGWLFSGLYNFHAILRLTTVYELSCLLVFNAFIWQPLPVNTVGPGQQG